VLVGLTGPVAAEVLLGVAAPLTGPMAWAGAEARKGAELALAALNESGGVLGERVVAVVVDDHCDAEQAVAAAHKLLESRVAAVVGHQCSGAAGRLHQSRARRAARRHRARRGHGAGRVRFANDYAPEHLEVLSDEPLHYLGQLQHAGEILLGENSVNTLGNYLIGPNCVLPTGGHARTWSPLSVHDFMKRTSIAQVTRAGYLTLAPYAHTLATYEGFDAHANAVSPLREGTADA
jgi:histidinol dehydrogenase